MAPDAPTPTYDEQGNLALEWLLVARYDPAREVVTVSWSKDGDLFRRSLHGAIALPHDEMVDVQEAIRTTLVMLANPTLF